MYFESEDKISYDSEYYEEIESDIKDIEKRIEMAEGEDRIVLLGHLRDLKLEYTYYEHECLYAEKYKAAQYSYKMEILNNLLDLKHYILDIEYGCELYTEEEKNEFSSSENEEAKNYSLVRQEYDELFSLLENGEYSEYIDYQKNIILDDPAIDEATKKSRVEFFDLLLKVCPSGEYSSYEEKEAAESLLYDKMAIEDDLISGIDYDGLNLTEETTETLKKDLAIINKKIELSLLDEDTSSSLIDDGYVMSFSVGNLFSVIILIIVAGALISHEVSTGTIKSLIIAPVKRWKIFASKYVTILIFSVILTLYTYIMSILINGLLFGFDNYGSKVFYVAGKAVEMNYMLSQFISAICTLVPVLYFVTFVFVLSAATKSTATSVSVSMGIYLGGNLLHLALVELLRGFPYIIKFMPYSNLQWYNLFMYSGSDFLESMDVVFVSGEVNQSGSLLFSVIYTVILLVCMLWIGHDSFCRRDIK